MRKLLFAGLISIASTPGIAASVISGDYEGLLIGVDRKGVLTGYFESSTGEGRFNCIFFIKGKINGSVFNVDTWFPGDVDPIDVIPGEIEITSKNDIPSISVKLDAEHGDCWNVQRFEPKPVSFSLYETGKWKAIRITAAEKAYFYDNISRPHRRKAYVTSGDLLRVFETKPGWVNAEYIKYNGTRTRGWILERDLFSATSPAANQQEKH